MNKESCMCNLPMKKIFFNIISFFIKEFINDTIYQPLRSGRIWHKVNF